MTIIIWIAPDQQYSVLKIIVWICTQVAGVDRAAITDGFYAGTNQSPQVIVIVIINDRKMLIILIVALFITMIIMQRHTKDHVTLSFFYCLTFCNKR